MYTTVKYNSWGASLYFLAWVVLGYYVFLTLFLAVTLEAFESKYDSDAALVADTGSRISDGDGLRQGSSLLASGNSIDAEYRLSQVCLLQ